MPVAVDQSLRGFLEALERDGELRRVAGPVSARFELSALLACEDGGPALLFESVEGSSIPVVGGVLGSRGAPRRGRGCRVRPSSRRACSKRSPRRHPRAR